MWSNWRPDVVERDFAQLASHGFQLLRIFPLWSEFQPIHALRQIKGEIAEYRYGEAALYEQGDVGEDGVSELMQQRLSLLLDSAHRHGLSLIVSLVTGWMSGRLFVPPALEAINHITDPISIKWQLRFVRALVRRHRDHPAISAWDLGNECNCLAAATREQGWLWTSAISDAIRSCDSTRKVISGMHSLKADPKSSSWTIRDQGELTDVLTTHPYSLFTPHCHKEPLNTMRPLLHAAAETCLYADLSGRPAIVEEFGTLGPMICNDQVAADMMRVRLLDIWVHDCRAALWWCAYDQSQLEQAPYDWLAIERELGLFRTDGTPKLAALAMQETKTFIDRCGPLPSRRIHAVCLLTEGQDQWGVAYTSFILAKQAGFELRFHYADRPLPDADLYLLPSVNSHAALCRRREKELWSKVEAGATLYLSLDQGTLGDFVTNSSLEIITRHDEPGEVRFEFNHCEMMIPSVTIRYRTRATGPLDSLAQSPAGDVVFCRSSFGKGTIFSLLAPLEASLAKSAGLLGSASGVDHGYWKIYRAIAEKSVSHHRLIVKASPWIGITEHPISSEECVAVMTNYSDQEITDVLEITDGWEVSQYARTHPDAESFDQGGESLSLRLAPAHSVVCRLIRTN